MRMSHVDTTPIEGLVRELWDRGGTDIHITAGSPPLLRIDGELFPVEGHAPLLADDTERLALALLPPEMQAAFIANKELDFSFSWKDVTRFRGNVYFQRGAVSLALRAIPYRIPTMQ